MFKLKSATSEIINSCSVMGRVVVQGLNYNRIVHWIGLYNAAPLEKSKAGMKEQCRFLNNLLKSGWNFVVRSSSWAIFSQYLANSKVFHFALFIFWFCVLNHCLSQLDLTAVKGCTLTFVRVKVHQSGSVQGVRWGTDLSEARGGAGLSVTWGATGYH